MTTFRIVVQIDPSGVRRGGRQVNRTLQNIQRQATQTGQLLRRAFGFAAAFVGVRALISFSNTAVQVRNRLRVLSADVNQLNFNLAALKETARETRSPLEAMVSLFQRGTLAAKELGASNKELLEFTRRVGLGLAIQGGSATSARGALIQLAQALGSGIVRAEEFNAILEGAFPIAQAAAKGLDRAGDSVAKLRRLIIDGKVSSEEFFNAFMRGSSNFAELFERTIPTLGQAFQVLSDRFALFLDDLNQGTGVLTGLSNAILFLADNVKVAVKAAIILGVTLGGPMLLRAVGNMLGLTAATNGLTASLRLATAAAKLLLRVLLVGFIIELAIALKEMFDLIARTPLTFAQVARVSMDVFVNSFINGFIAFGRGINNLIRIITDPMAAAFIVFGRSIPDLLFGGLAFTEMAERVGTAISTAFRDALERVGRDLRTDLNRRLVRIASDEDFEALRRARRGDVVPTDPLAGQAGEERGFARKAIELTKEQATALASLRKSLDPVGQAVRDLAAGEKLLRIAVLAGSITLEERDFLLGRLRQSLEDQIDPLSALNRELDEERRLLLLGADAREVEADLLQRVEDLREAGVVLTEAQTNALRGELAALQKLNDERDRMDSLLRDIRGPAQDLEKDMAALNKLHRQGAVSAEEFTVKQRELRIAFLETQRDVQSGIERTFLKMEESTSNAAAAVERLLTDAFQSAEDAFVKFVQTGKFEFTDFINDIQAQLLRLAFRQTVAQIGTGLFSQSGGSATETGAAGIFGSLDFGSLFGFQRGAQGVPVNALSVGRTTGADNRLVAFRANSNETVDVNRRGGGNDRPVQVNFNITTPDVNGFRRSQRQLGQTAALALRQADVKGN
jgi:lambda family phage tail tape measure protein